MQISLVDCSSPLFVLEAFAKQTDRRLLTPCKLFCGPMAVKSPTVDKVASNDPFQISRLAEELESRDLRPSSSSNTPTHDLPLLAPLSHSNPHLTAPEFSIEEFLLSRAHTSLPDLRSELRDYLGSLKEELVKLINDDYAAFISLSTDLRGEGVRLERLKYPLGMLKSEILVSSSLLPTQFQ